MFGCMQICLFREKFALFVHCAHLREAECLSVLPLPEAFYAHLHLAHAVTKMALARYDLHGPRQLCIAAFNASRSCQHRLAVYLSKLSASKSSLCCMFAPCIDLSALCCSSSDRFRCDNSKNAGSFLEQSAHSAEIARPSRAQSLLSGDKHWNGLSLCLS